MLKSKKWIAVVILVVVYFAGSLYFREKDENIKRVSMAVAVKRDERKNKERKEGKRDNKEKSQGSFGFLGETCDNDLVFKNVSAQEIGERSLELVRSLYKMFDDMDFSDAYPAETVFVRMALPDGNGPGYYLTAIRNSQNEIMARAVLAVLKDGGDGTFDLEAGNVEPFPPAYSDLVTQERYRKFEKHSLTDSFPRISEEQATEIIKKKFSNGSISSGLASIFVNLPGSEHPYQIGTWFTPYWEFSEIGNEDKKAWVNSESGLIIDQAHIDREIELFKKEWNK